MKYAAAAAALALATTASAAKESSKAVVQNNCEFPVHVWTTCNGAEVTARGELAPGGTQSDDFGEGSCEVKVAQSDKALENGEAQSSLVYAVSDDEVRYSLSHVLGPFFATLKADGDTDECGVIDWEDGQAGDLEQSCSSERMIRISLCDADGESSGAAESSAAAGDEGEEDPEEPEQDEEEEEE